MVAWAYAKVVAILLVGLADAGTPSAPIGLRCDYRKTPPAVDEPAPVLSWRLKVGRRGLASSAYQIQVASAPGFADEGPGFFDTGKVESTDQRVRYRGPLAEPSERRWWRVRFWDAGGEASPWSEASWWEAGLGASQSWRGVWIAANGEAGRASGGNEPAQLFRRTFTVERPVKRARLYGAGLGYGDAMLNGQRVGDERLGPAWTNYDKRVFYTTHDVTGLLSPGENVLGYAVGNGWWNPLPLRMWGRLNLRDHLPVGPPCLRCQLSIEYEDGATETIASDDAWRVHAGPTTFNNVYLGERYDARRRQAGWSRPDFDDSQWDHAKPAARPPRGVMVAESAPPIRVVNEISPKKVTRHRDKTLYDFGENLTGCVRLALSRSQRRVVRLRYCELLTESGELNPLTTVCGQIKRAGVGGPGAPDVAEQVDQYTPRGDGAPSSWAPRFTFHGFRYAELTNLQGDEAPTLTAQRMRSEVKPVGRFCCSDPYLNRLHEVCRRTFESNLMGVQSDCPHRERFGYGGDIAVTADAFMLNYDMATFYRKSVRDFADAARADGSLTETAPHVGIAARGVGDGGGPVSWALAHPLLVDRLRRHYGMDEFVREQYPIARRWLRRVRELSPDGLIRQGLGDHESLDATPAGLVATANYCYAAKLVARLANVVGERGEAAEFERLSEQVRRAFLAEYVDRATGVVGPATQTSQAAALQLGLNGSVATSVFARLVRSVEEKQRRLSTGIFGTPWMLAELSRRGEAGLAYEIVAQRGYPGWRHMLDRGATTLWEHWSYSDNTFSHNHPMFGSVSQWLCESVGGLAVAEEAVACDRLQIAPRLTGVLDWAETTYDSVRGPVVCQWRRSPGRLEINVVIPAGATATVRVPTHDAAAVQESGVAASGSEHVETIATDEASVTYEVAPGRYRFVTPR